MNNENDLSLVLGTGVPIVVIETQDEPQVLDMLANLIGRLSVQEYRPVFRWSVTDGLQRLDLAIKASTEEEDYDPAQVLKRIRANTQPGVYVLLDYHPYLQDPVNVRSLKDIALCSGGTKTVVLVSHAINIPPEIERLTARFDLALPNEPERAGIVREVAGEWVAQNPGQRVKTDAKALNLLIKNLSGLTISDTRRLARNAIFHDGAISKSDLAPIMKAKYELLNANSVLSYEYDTRALSDVAGMARLKEWLVQRKSVFAADQPVKNLDPPKGVVLLGVQGCGKSLAAKAVAGLFSLPLLRLDFATLYDKYHGETERNLREALALASVMKPCVLWIDEMEKGLASGNDNSGTSKRVLGSFLTWTAERAEGVFVVATVNNIDALPPELLRKGRFDEIFFVDLPDFDTRLNILTIHLERRELDPATFDIHALATKCDGFSGAEIEQAVVAALYDAYSRKESLSVEHLAREISQTRPLSVTMAESIDALRRWAVDRTVSAS